MITLTKDWRTILRKAWSVRLIALAALLSGIEVALPFADGVIPRGVFAGLSLVVTSAAFVARIAAQPGMDT